VFGRGHQLKIVWTNGQDNSTGSVVRILGVTRSHRLGNKNVNLSRAERRSTLKHRKGKVSVKRQKTKRENTLKGNGKSRQQGGTQDQSLDRDSIASSDEWTRHY